MLARLSPVILGTLMLCARCVHLLHHLLPQQMVKSLMMLQLVAQFLVELPLKKRRWNCHLRRDVSSGLVEKLANKKST